MKNADHPVLKQVRLLLVASTEAGWTAVSGQY